MFVTTSATRTLQAGCILLIASCTNQKPETQASVADPELKIPKAQHEAAALLLPSCPIASAEVGQPESPGLAIQAFLAIGGALIQSAAPEVAGAGLGFLADYFDQRAANRNAASTGAAQGNLWKLMKMPGEQVGSVQDIVVPAYRCLVFVRGEFGPEPPMTNTFNKISNSQTSLSLWSSSETDNVNDAVRNAASPLTSTTSSGDNSTSSRSPALTSSERDVLRQRFSLRGYPDLYIEYQIDYPQSPLIDQTGATQSKWLATEMTLVPVTFIYAKSGARVNEDSKKRVSTLVTLEMDVFDQAKNAKERRTVMSAPFGFGDRAPAVRLSAQDLGHFTYASIPLTYPYQEQVSTAQGSDTAMLNLVAMRATVAVNETEGGGDFDRAIAKAIRAEGVKKASSDQLAAALTKLLNRVAGVDEGKDGEKQDGSQ